MPTVKYTVPNISCMHCVHTIQSELGELTGVTSVKVEATSKVVEITFTAPADEEKIRRLMSDISYPVK